MLFRPRPRAGEGEAVVPGFVKRAGLVVLGCAATVALSAFQKPAVAPADLSVFFDATSTDPKVSSPAMTALTRTWRPAYVPMLLELVRFTIPPAASRAAGAEAGGDARPPGPWQRLIDLLERQTGQEFGTDLRRWRQWLWKQSYDPHPEYAAFKAAVYRRIDPRMAEFFTGRPTIRFDEVEWGGVKVNAIPPLVSPKTVPVAGAAYLQDSNVVFGIVIGEEARTIRSISGVRRRHKRPYQPFPAPRHCDRNRPSIPQDRSSCDEGPSAIPGRTHDRTWRRRW
jgi:hypothetical protein